MTFLPGGARLAAGLRAAALGVAALLALAASGCADRTGSERAVPADSTTAAVSEASEGAAREPGTFAGRLPCADCPGIEATLTLRRDGTYLFRWVYLEARDGVNDTTVDFGGWERIGRTLALHPGTGTARRFAWPAPDSLRMLDGEGNPIPSRLGPGLVRTGRAAPIRHAVSLTGMYAYAGDRGWFTECVTGREFPVVGGGALRGMERAYARAISAPGEPLWASVRGRFVPRPRPEPGSDSLAVAVEAFTRFEPGRTCASH